MNSSVRGYVDRLYNRLAKKGTRFRRKTMETRLCLEQSSLAFTGCEESHDKRLELTEMQTSRRI
jgi:hypothetical protein